MERNSLDNKSLSSVSNDSDCLICYNPTKKYMSSSEIRKAFENSDDTNEDLYSDDFELDEYKYNQDTKEHFLGILKNQNCKCVYHIHFECLLVWLLENPSCPMCRNKVILNTYDTNTPIFFIHYFNTTFSISDGLNSQYLIDLKNYLPNRLNPSVRNENVNSNHYNIAINNDGDNGGDDDNDNGSDIDNGMNTLYAIERTTVIRRDNAILFPAICIVLFVLIMFISIFSIAYSL